VKTVSKCLAHKKGCWYPEFEPSVEEMMDLSMRYGDSLSSLSLASSVYWGDFPVQSSLFEAGRVNFLGYSCACAQR
jgi:hypothetical protein